MMDRELEIYLCRQRHKTLREAGEELGVSVEHVRQYTNRILRMLENHKERGRWAREDGQPRDAPSDKLDLPAELSLLRRSAWERGWDGQ